MTGEVLPNLTTMLFVPANKRRMVEKAQTLDASAVILDLEDGVGIGEKDEARATAAEILAEAWPVTPLLFVRVNGPSSPHFEADLEAVAPVAPFGVCIPKCESASDVEAAAAALARHRAPDSVRLLPFVESACGVIRAFEIASASDRVVAMALGSEDLAADMSMRRTKAAAELIYFRSAISTAAHAAGIVPIDTVFIDFGDPDGLFADASVGRGLGFGGKQIIHPSQIAPVHRAYAPTDEELARAERIVAAFDEAERDGRGVVVVDGRMIDRPIVLQARRLLGR